MNDTDINDLNYLQNKMELSINEYKRWLNLYIRSMGGNLPGVPEWRIIKSTLDKVKQYPTPHHIDPSWINPFYRGN